MLDTFVLFKAFQSPVRDFEAATKGFHLSPEELFWQTVVSLDYIKEHQGDAMLDVDRMWNDIFVGYRDLSDEGDGDEENVALFASLTVMAIETCLAMCEFPLYRTMALSLATQLAEHNDPSERMEAAILNNITRIGTEVFGKAIRDYMESDERWLSDEIEDVLETIPDIHSGGYKAEDANLKQSNQLTCRQIVILFEQLLNVSLSSADTNIQALAKLLEKVSVYKASSLRTTINTLAKKGYDSVSVKNDIEHLATLVEKVKPKLAEQLRNIAED